MRVIGWSLKEVSGRNDADETVRGRLLFQEGLRETPPVRKAR
jgi:hypothetical protein